MCDDLFFINTMQNTLEIFQKKTVSILRMVDEKVHTRKFQLKGIGRIQSLADALSLKYIKLVIPKMLYIGFMQF